MTIKKISIAATNSIFPELANQHSFPYTAIAEFIDNSYSAICTDTSVIDIDVRGDWTGERGILKSENSVLIIKDNGKGMNEEQIALFISPFSTANKSSKTLNRHGCGAKMALAALGAEVDKNTSALINFKIFTKTADASYALSFDKLSYGDIDLEVLSKEDTKKLFPCGHGTIIEIYNPNIVKQRQLYNEQIIIPLSVRYQNQLKTDGYLNKKLIINFSLKDNNNTVITDSSKNKNEYSWALKPVKPYLTGGDNWALSNHLIKDSNFSVRFNFGISISRDELELLDDESLIKEVKKTCHPYHVKKPTVDCFSSEGILICQLPASRIFGPSWDRYFRNGVPRLQIYFLNHCYDTTLVKNEIKFEYWDSLSDSIKDVKTVKFHTDESFKNYDTESELAAALFKIAKVADNKAILNSTLIAGSELKPDITLPNKQELWEIKNIRSGEPEVVQLFGYLMLKQWKNGKLIAPNFSTNAFTAVKKLNDLYDLNMELEEISTYL